MRDELVRLLRDEGHLELDAPVQLASGDWSRHFIDVKRALATGRAVALAARTILELVEAEGIAFDSVGGLTMGADVLAHGVAMARPEVRWFSVRKQAKDRGTARRIEGADLGADARVLLVDDVVTRGGSIFDALGAIRATGATVVAAVTVVDRGDYGAPAFEAEGVPYLPLTTYRDLGMPAVGTEPGVTSETG
ncbi:MAG TPA: phosphoribosyltransferase family protein [Acidimicrobiales bacterium]